MNRPRGMAEYKAASARFATAEGRARGLAYRPDPTDVFIAPYAKCGTTWMQQIVHGLRTGGDMAFDEITAAVPWIEMAHDMGLAIPGDQPAPRAFKSHLGWHEIPKGGRYIVVLRDPVDAMRSLFRFLEGWFFEPGSIGLDEFALDYLDRSDRDDYWTHAASWWRVRNRDEVLLLAYEHMRADLPRTVARVAAFLGLDDAQTIAIATRQASFDFMKAHERQFDDHLLRAARDAACGLPPGGAASKVHEGRVAGEAHLVPPAIRARYGARWAGTMGAEFGLETYRDALDALDRAA
ncbi:sulfotransferase domain-containing protein [Roseovarius sp. SCSIO 43702]|uniref:sulfotransferase domain-containing protein n=1 Tax=Roseovarius sp. SCSIO 43702 TaxID=2823043 RepID=UPI001C72C819|nr:sulfotransferase domain-containing protein [Roseovarius sp. SCSIO 43702]QYX57630.1 sulfotransferase domain-containing protein [Roseovarius sp. SCSIO 43702]